MQLNGTFDVKLGQSFRNPAAANFMTMRCDFMPASVDRTQPGSIKVDDGKEVVVNLPNVASAGAPGSTVFRGSARPVQKECVLIFNKRTGELTLERVAHAVQLKKTREETQKTTPPIQNAVGSAPSGKESGSSSNHMRSTTLSGGTASVQRKEHHHHHHRQQQQQPPPPTSRQNQQQGPVEPNAVPAVAVTKRRTLSCSSSSSSDNSSASEDESSPSDSRSSPSHSARSSDGEASSTSGDEATPENNNHPTPTAANRQKTTSPVAHRAKSKQPPAQSHREQHKSTPGGRKSSTTDRASPRAATGAATAAVAGAGASNLSAHRNLMELDLKLSDSDSDEAF